MNLPQPPAGIAWVRSSAEAMMIDVRAPRALGFCTKLILSGPYRKAATNAFFITTGRFTKGHDFSHG
jgi:hypothetical protein